MLDFAHTPNLVMDSIYYADDDRVEIIGDKGVIFINRCTARTVDLPPLMLFKDGRTSAVPVERIEWHDSFIDCTRHLIDVLTKGGQPQAGWPHRQGRAGVQPGRAQVGARGDRGAAGRDRPVKPAFTSCTILSTGHSERVDG